MLIPDKTFMVWVVVSHDPCDSNGTTVEGLVRQDQVDGRDEAVDRVIPVMLKNLETTEEQFFKANPFVEFDAYLMPILVQDA